MEIRLQPVYADLTDGVDVAAVLHHFGGDIVVVHAGGRGINAGEIVVLAEVREVAVVPGDAAPVLWLWRLAGALTAVSAIVTF